MDSTSQNRVVCGPIQTWDDERGNRDAHLMQGLEIWIAEEIDDELVRIAFKWFDRIIDTNKIYRKDFEEHTCERREYHLRFFRSLIDPSIEVPIDAVKQYEIVTARLNAR